MPEHVEMGVEELTMVSKLVVRSGGEESDRVDRDGEERNNPENVQAVEI